MRLPSHWWWDLSARDFASLDMGRIVAVLPVAAVESHGPHLPVRVDAAINAGLIERVVARMPDDLPVLVLPMQPVGKSVEHIAFPGTLTLGHETLSRVWFEIAESVHRSGCRKIVFANSHGGQPQVMEIVCRELRVRLGMFAVSAWASGAADVSDLFDADELRHGIHGGEVETSEMLALHPELVSMDRAGTFEPVSVAMEAAGGLLTPEGRIGYGWQMQDLHPSGAAGNAAAADAARGEEALERGAESFLRLLREVVDFPLERVTGATMFDGPDERSGSS